jgi:hypothetical protein
MGQKQFDKAVRMTDATPNLVSGLTNMKEGAEEFSVRLS